MEFGEKRDRYRVLSRKDRIVLKIYEGDAPHLVAEVVIPRAELPALHNAVGMNGVEMLGEGRCMVTTYRYYA